MQLIDISLPIDENLPSFPGDPVYTMTRTATHDNDNLVLSNLKIGTHTGTHIDFPLHFIEGGKTAEIYDITKFSGKALILDLSHITLGQAITLTELEKKKIDQYTGIDFILFKTVNSTIYQKEFNTKFVYLDHEAATYLTRFDLKGVGIDYLSIEQYGFVTPSTHITLLERDILILEGLYLAEVGEGVCKLFAFPLNIENAEGVPLRAVLEMD